MKHPSIFGSWMNSIVYVSPLYFGIRQGNRIERIGWNHSGVQDVIQNGWHLLIGSPLFKSGEYSNPYFYSGYNNPFTLYNF